MNLKWYPQRVKTLYDHGGIREVFRGIRDFIYTNKVYDRLFRDDLSGVRVGTGFGYLPVHSRRNKDRYKHGLMQAIGDYVEAGNKVTIVGSRGVDVVHSIWAGATTVDVYEGALPMVHKTRQTVQHPYNDIDASKVTVHHAVIGDPVDVYAPIDCVEMIPPQRLTTGDVLCLDCEGSEVSIIGGLYDLPRTLIVETHPRKGAPDGVVTSLLKKRGYGVTRYEFEKDLIRPGKAVLVGTQ